MSGCLPTLPEQNDHRVHAPLYPPHAQRFERFPVQGVRGIMRTLLLALLLLPSGLSAQHCGYDFSAILVLRPHAGHHSTVIGELRITLLDSNNVPFTYNGRPYPPFFRNTDRKAWDTPGVNHRPVRNDDLLFPFAQDNYVLVIGQGMDLRGCSILVQDERSWMDGAVYRQVLVPLRIETGYSLCGHYNDQVYHTHPEEVPFAPIDITLYQR